MKTHGERTLDDDTAYQAYHSPHVSKDTQKIEQRSQRNFYPDRNPNPVLTLGKKGEVIYANEAGAKLLDASRRDEISTSFLQDLENFAAKAIATKRTIRQRLTLNVFHFSFSFCPRRDEDLVDLYGIDVSDEIRHQTYFSVVSAFSTALLAANTEDDVAWAIAGEAIARLGFIDCVVYLVDRKERMLVQKAAHGPKSPKSLRSSIVDPISLNFGEGIVGAAATQLETIIIGDVTQDKRYVLDDEQRMSEIAVPIIADGEIIGVIDSEHPDPDRFSREDAKILEAVAAIAATRIQRSRAMEEIKHTEAKYRSFVENAFGGLYILRDEAFEYANDQFCKIIGYSSEELLSETFRNEDLIFSADEKAADAIEARLRGDFSPKSYHLEIRTKSGEIRQLAVNTSILNDENGPFTLGIALDITETIKSRHQLEEVIASLEKKSDELNEFAHLASHNLRSPVTNLIGLLNHYNHDNPNDETNLQIVDKFSKTVGLLNLTLEEMHQVLRVRAQEEFDYNTADLNEIVNGVKLQLSEKIRTADFRIETEFEVETVNYEKSHLENLFLNLISNSLKYRKPDVDPFIKIRSTKQDNRVRMEFMDNGIGIDMNKHRKNLFGMYQRFHNNPEGRGVGLYLVKRQLNALGSTISLKSEPNKGSCFTVDLASK